VSDEEGTKTDHPTAEERAARGEVARKRVPREGHEAWEPPADRVDPIEILERQAADRIPELIPIRYGRMVESPFAFYRGAAAIMASDLAGTPGSELYAQLSGDAHLMNFGAFASPERDLVFDLNDFDETHPGPWEWDVKRLAASLEIAARERGFAASERRSIVVSGVREYRQTIRRFAAMRDLDVWYARLDAVDAIERWRREANSKELKAFEKATAKARRKDNLRAFDRLTTEVDGEPRIISDPPLIVPLEELGGSADHGRLERVIHGMLESYRRSLQLDRRLLLERFRYAHAARKVVGVGSVGTREWIILLLGRDHGDPLFLQVKEAGRSVLEPFAGRSQFAQQGRRIVEGQRLMQAASDVLLGWERAEGINGRLHDFYVRQLWDWKRSAHVEVMSPATLAIYAEMCAWTLARAHARSGDRIAIAAYLGSGDAFDRAISRFAAAYADQNERDHKALVDAVASARITAETGI
jgi:uncharacterized protein (DUF2252 family)